MSTSKILKGTTILGIAGILVKLLGAVFRIPLTALIGTRRNGILRLRLSALFTVPGYRNRPDPLAISRWCRKGRLPETI